MVGIKMVIVKIGKMLMIREVLARGRSKWHGWRDCLALKNDSPILWLINIICTSTPDICLVLYTRKTLHLFLLFTQPVSGYDSWDWLSSSAHQITAIMSFFIRRRHIQGGFFYWSALKMTKYEERSKYSNWSANCSSRKVLSVNLQ